MPKKHDDFYTFTEQLKSIYYILPTVCLVVVATMYVKREKSTKREKKKRRENEKEKEREER